MAKKANSGGVPASNGFLGQLQLLTGSSGTLELEGLDGLVLWCAVVAMAERRASVTLGVTQDGASWVLQIWDGKYPAKWYFRETPALNRHLAAIVRTDKGNRVSPEVEKRLQEYGW